MGITSFLCITFLRLSAHISLAHLLIKTNCLFQFSWQEGQWVDGQGLLIWASNIISLKSMCKSESTQTFWEFYVIKSFIHEGTACLLSLQSSRGTVTEITASSLDYSLDLRGQRSFNSPLIHLLPCGVALEYRECVSKGHKKCQHWKVGIFNLLDLL